MNTYNFAEDIIPINKFLQKLQIFENLHSEALYECVNDTK